MTTKLRATLLFNLILRVEPFCGSRDFCKQCIVFIVDSYFFKEINKLQTIKLGISIRKNLFDIKLLGLFNPHQYLGYIYTGISGKLMPFGQKLSSSRKEILNFDFSNDF